MRFYLLAVLAIILSLPAAAQFRMVGVSGGWTVVNDSTYSASITFSSDLTGQGYLANQITTSYRMFTPTEQQYRVSNVANATFNTADLTVIEYNGDHGTPVGQVLVYNPDSKATIAQAPFGSTGATAQMNAAVDAFNARQVSESTSLADGDKGDITVGSSGASWTIDNDAVDAAAIAANAVTSSEIQDGAVTSGKIGTGAVGATQLASTTVTPGAYTYTSVTFDADGRATAASSGSAPTKTTDALTQGTVTARVTRFGGSATTISTPSAGVYDLDLKSGSDTERVRVFGNNTTLNGSNEFILTIDNSANSIDREFSVQVYQVNTGALVDQQATGTNHTQTTSGNVTTITFPGMNGFGATGFFITLR